MKKILLATSALVASAGFASADISLSGDARLGLSHTGGVTTLQNRFRVTFAGSGETDGGLAFGAKMRLDNSGAVGGHSVWISGGFGKLTVGTGLDTAANQTTGNVSSVGLTGHGARLGGYIGSANVVYSYSGSGLSVAISGDTTVAGTYALGVGYAMDSYSFGVGYGKTVAATQVSLNAKGTFGTTTVKAAYEKTSTSAAATVALSVDADLSGVGVTAFVARPAAGGTSYGIGASYDLGGGAKLKGGYSNGSAVASVIDFGLALTF